MKTINSIKKIFFLCSLTIIINGCETLELDILDSPNALNHSTANPEFYVNAIQLSLKNFFYEVTEPGMETTRILHMFGPLYQNAYAPSDLDSAWSIAYSGIMPDVRALEAVAEEQGLYTHLAIGQLAEAYAITTLVDYLGDIPYSESNDGESFNPVADSGASIYTNMLSLIDSAISNLNAEETRLPTKDFYYGGDESKWIKFANTLKLKIYVQSRLVNEAESISGINAILASGNYIQSSNDDFQFDFSTADTNPDSRHPIFARNFQEGTGSSDYMSNTYMNYMVNDTENEDPRKRHYFYRQRSFNAVNTVEQSCYGGLPPAHIGFTNIYCNLGEDAPGYWGRDHGYDFGIPPDTNIRTAWGLYPVGGNFDDESFTPIVDRTISTKGAGIEPIMLSSFVDFMLAETALVNSSLTGDAASYLESAITKSIDKVTSFRTDQVDSNYASSSDDIDNYIAEIMDRFNSSTADEKMNVIAKEYFKALWGNGVEAFNTYRRTGKPTDLQELVREPVTNFLRSFYYPDNYVLQNTNAEQKSDVTDKVFWDNNPDNGFIK
jgi:hypothetical protein